MKLATIVSLFSAVLVLAFASTVRAQAPAPVRTQSGLVQGTVVSGIRVYKGIPFAAPPTGELRWQPPQPPKPWKGVLHAEKFADACMQVPIVERDLGLDPVTPNEDCLT